MIRTYCPKCQTKLTAKEEWVGRLARCPKCEARLRIPPSDGPAEAVAEPQIHGVSEESLPTIETPGQLEQGHRYLICGQDRLVAAWESDSQGWKLRTPAGMVMATRNAQLLPATGTYRLIDLDLTQGTGGLQLVGIEVYRLAEHYALTVLARGEHEILEKIAGPGGLSREQKLWVLQYVKDRFMYEVWQHSHAVMDYLTGPDVHASGAREA